MARWGLVEEEFWRNPQVRALSDDAKLLLLYLFTGPHRNTVGCFVLPLAYISADLKWSDDKVTQTLSELSRKPFLMRDVATEFILLLGWWGHNLITNRNHAKCIVDAICDLPSSSLKDRAIDNLKRYAKGFPAVKETVATLLAQRYPAPTETLSIGFPAATDTLSETLSTDASDTLSIGYAKPTETLSPPITVTVTKQNSLASLDARTREATESNGHTKPRRRKPEVAIPEAWAPNETAYALGHDHGLTPAEVDAEAAACRSHALSHDRRCANWDHAFLNWLRKGFKHRAEKRTATGPFVPDRGALP